MAVATPTAPLVPRPRATRVVAADVTGRQWSTGSASRSIFVVTLIAIAVPLLAPHDPLMPVGMPLQAPGQNGFLLGTDSVGRDILSRVLYGVRSSWFAALVVVAIGLLVGGLVGLIAGATGGWVDTVLMRITDGFLALPAPVLAIAVVAALGPGFVHTLIAVSIVWWPFYARMVRGEVPTGGPTTRRGGELAGVSPSGSPGVTCCPVRCPTAGHRQPRHRHLILTLAALSFLGLGQSAPAPELGADAARNLSYLPAAVVGSGDARPRRRWYSP